MDPIPMLNPYKMALHKIETHVHDLAVLHNQHPQNQLLAEIMREIHRAQTAAKTLETPPQSIQSVISRITQNPTSSTINRPQSEILTPLINHIQKLSEALTLILGTTIHSPTHPKEKLTNSNRNSLDPDTSDIINRLNQLLHQMQQILTDINT